MTHETDEGKTLWNNIVGQLSPAIQARHTAQMSSSQVTTKKFKKKKPKNVVLPTPNDPSNPFSVLAI
jgi:hypothetical protein